MHIVLALRGRQNMGWGDLETSHDLNGDAEPGA